MLIRERKKAKFTKQKFRNCESLFRSLWKNNYWINYWIISNGYNKKLHLHSFIGVTLCFLSSLTFTPVTLLIIIYITCFIKTSWRSRNYSPFFSFLNFSLSLSSESDEKCTSHQWTRQCPPHSLTGSRFDKQLIY